MRASISSVRVLPALCWPIAIAGACELPADPTPQALDDVETLTVAEGITFHIEPFDVPAGTELQYCYFVTMPDLNGDGSPVSIDRFKVGVRSGSHHMNVFRVGTILALDGEPGPDGTPGAPVRNGECFKSGNWADWPLVVNSQESTSEEPIADWRLPDGVAYRFTPGEKLMLQVHYVNADTQKTPGGAEVKLNFYRSQETDPMEMGTLFATQQSIRICASNPSVTYNGTCAFPAGTAVTVAAANGHFHSRGDRFRVFAWDGFTDEEPGAESLFYESTEWAEPPMSLNLNVRIPDGGGVWWRCDYTWERPLVGCDAVDARDPQGADDCCYTFGPVVETSEHCNVFVYYWPKVESDIFCN